MIGIAVADVRMSSHDFKRAAQMQLTIETDREDDGRWIADVLELPGVLAYGETRSAAVGAVKALAMRVLTARIERGELEASGFQFQASAA